MRSVANSTSGLSCSLPEPDPDTIHGVPLADLLARCHSMALRFHGQHNRRQPLAEYLSAGHGAIASCIGTYDPRKAPPGGFLSFTCFRMEMRLREVMRTEAGSNNLPRHQKGVQSKAKYQVESWDHPALYSLRIERARQETTVYLHEVLAYVGQHGTAGAMLLATVEGASVNEVAAQSGCSPDMVVLRCVRLRRKLRAWAAAVAYAADEERSTGHADESRAISQSRSHQ